MNFQIRRTLYSTQTCWMPNGDPINGDRDFSSHPTTINSELKKSIIAVPTVFSSSIPDNII